jgi:hypothetical protein
MYNNAKLIPYRVSPLVDQAGLAQLTDTAKSKGHIFLDVRLLIAITKGKKELSILLWNQNSTR